LNLCNSTKNHTLIKITKKKYRIQILLKRNIVMLEEKGMDSVEQHRAIGELPEGVLQEMLCSKGM
jgi:hypothetical protein